MDVLMVKDGIVEWVVSITEDQIQKIREMYPDHQVVIRIGDEDAGWTFDGEKFSAPQG